MKRRLLAFALCFVMAMTAAPTVTFAEPADEAAGSVAVPAESAENSAAEEIGTASGMEEAAEAEAAAATAESTSAESEEEGTEPAEPASGIVEAEPASEEDVSVSVPETEGTEEIAADGETMPAAEEKEAKEEDAAPQKDEEGVQNISRSLASPDGSVSIVGVLPESAVVSGGLIGNPFAAPALRGSKKSLAKNAALAEGKNAAQDGFASRNYLAFYDLKLVSDGVQVQPDGAATVTISGLPLKEGRPLSVLHILDDAEAIKNGIAAGSLIGVNEEAFVSKFPAEAAAAQEATGLAGVVYIEMIQPQVLGPDSIRFAVESFSIFAIIEGDEPGEDEPARRTYQFLDEKASGYEPFSFYNKAGRKVSTQILKDGESLENVVYPETASNKIFLGWYLVDYNPGTKQVTGWHDTVQFETPLTVTQTETVYVAPRFKTSYYVSFHLSYYGHVTPEGIDVYNDILTKKRVDVLSGETGEVVVGDVTAEPLESGMRFVGWQEYKNGAAVGDVTYTISGTGTIDTTVKKTGITSSIDIYPVYQEVHWIYYVAGAVGSGASYIQPLLVVGSTDLSKLEVPTREYYTFKGWYTEANGAGEQITDEEGNVLVSDLRNRLANNDLTVYAKWVPASEKSTYTIFIWKQDVHDGKTPQKKTYNFGSSYEIEADTDSAVPTDYNTLLSLIRQKLNDNRYDPREYGFTLSTDNVITASGPTVSPDGKTKVNIYFDRKLMTVHFRGTFAFYQQDENGSYGMVNGSYVELQNNYREWQLNGATYDGTRYETANDDNGTQYGVVGGRLVQLTRTESGGGCGGGGDVSWSYQGSPYTGTRYRTTTSMTGTQYGTSGGGLVPLTLVTIEGLSYNGVPYDGPRYSLRNTTNPDYTGLFGSTLEENGYSWPGNSDWYETRTGSSSRLTVLDAFKFEGLDYNNETDSDREIIAITLYQRDHSGTREVRFYKQALDDSWPDTPADTVTVGRYSSFTITDKYTGFTAYQYNNDGRWRDVGRQNNDGTYGSAHEVPSSGMSIRFQRHKHDIVFYSGGRAYRTIGDVPFDMPLEQYKPVEVDIGFEATIDGVPCTFQGWYDNEACAGEPFNFSGGRMPDDDLLLHAKWEPKYYLIRIDPNGGELAESDATYRWAQYGQKQYEYNISRNYVKAEDGTGTHKYVVHTYDEYLDQYTAQEIWDLYDQLDRTAKYVADADGEYKYQPGLYAFVGWYKVKPDGTLEADAYNFEQQITEDITLRAVWKRVDRYNVYYNPTKEVNGEIVSGTLDVSQDLGYAENAETMILTEPANITDGYVFKGWQIVTQDGSVLDAGPYRKGDKLIIDPAKTSNNNMYLQATYESVEESDEPVSVTYIHFDPNGGTGSAYTTPALQINDRYSLAEIGPNPAYIKEDYELVGWAFNKNAAPDEIDFAVDAVVGADNFDAEGDNTKANTLYAVWKETEVTICYRAVGPDGTVYAADSDVAELTSYEEKVAARTGTPAGSTAAPASDLYRFIGWYSDEACTQKIGDAALYTPARTGSKWVEATYYAKFEKNTKTLTISKNGMESGDSALITVTGKGFESGLALIVPNGQSVTVDGVYIGSTYTITEDENWSWRYTRSDSNTSITISADGENTVAVTNTLTNTKWLSDSDTIVNLPVVSKTKNYIVPKKYSFDGEDGEASDGEEP